jgi:hypothetical protein
MVSDIMSAAVRLPDELASGRFAQSAGRELVLSTLTHTLEEGPWGFLRRVRNGGGFVLGGVRSTVSVVANQAAKAAGLPYEVAPGVTVSVERPGGGVAGVAAPLRPLAALVAAPPRAVVRENGLVELPTVVYSFRGVEGAEAAEPVARTEREAAAEAAVVAARLPHVNEQALVAALVDSEEEGQEQRQRAAAPQVAPIMA